jgi:hypothetical protein
MAMSWNGVWINMEGIPLTMSLIPKERPQDFTGSVAEEVGQIRLISVDPLLGFVPNLRKPEQRSLKKNIVRQQALSAFGLLEYPDSKLELCAIRIDGILLML